MGSPVVLKTGKQKKKHLPPPIGGIPYCASSDRKVKKVKIIDTVRGEMSTVQKGMHAIHTIIFQIRGVLQYKTILKTEHIIL